MGLGLQGYKVWYVQSGFYTTAAMTLLLTMNDIMQIINLLNCLFIIDRGFMK